MSLQLLGRETNGQNSGTCSSCPYVIGTGRTDSTSVPDRYRHHGNAYALDWDVCGDTFRLRGRPNPSTPTPLAKEEHSPKPCALVARPVTGF